MNTELLKKLLDAGLDADRAIALAKDDKTVPAAGVTQAVEQMSKSLKLDTFEARLAALEAGAAKRDKVMLAAADSLEAIGKQQEEMQKSLDAGSEKLEQMSKSLQPGAKAVQAVEDGETVPDKGADKPEEKPEVAIEQMVKSADSLRKKAQKAVLAAKHSGQLHREEPSAIMTEIMGAMTPEGIRGVCEKYNIALAD